MAKQRLDQLLVARGMAESRTKAQALIMAGLVYTGEKKLDKAGAEVAEDIELSVRGKEHPWVSRGGIKLAHAIQEFSIDVKDKVAIDVGASTGGFTDVLLINGATKVYAVDVGHGQLDVKLRNDPRVIVMEETNARHLSAAMFYSPLEGESQSAKRDAVGGEALNTPHGFASANPAPPQGGSNIIFDLVVCDASFISLTKVLPAALALTKANAQLITLIKPQFEVGKVEASKGEGVIRDPALHQQVCDDIKSWITSEGWRVIGISESPITGPAGNKEFLLYAVKP